jgi:hypothetical protein
MAEHSSGIVKKNQVNLAGRRRLGAAGPATRSAGGPAARVLRQDDAGALIEVTCACGRKTHLQCDYAAAGGQAAEDGS